MDLQGVFERRSLLTHSEQLNSACDAGSGLTQTRQVCWHEVASRLNAVCYMVCALTQAAPHNLFCMGNG